MQPFAKTPEPLYYAVIFTAQRMAPAFGEDDGYGQTADRMVELAQGMPGYLGIESTRDGAGLGITVSYWASEADIAGWKRHMEHQSAQERGKKQWYEHYELRVARVERAYSGPEGRTK